jgi:hypothetical protein
MFLCPKCHRHVRETLCPFCGAAQAGPRMGGPSAVTIGMKRSAFIAAVAALGGGVACGDTVGPSVDYGIAMFDGGTEAATDAGKASDASDGGASEAGAADASDAGPDVVGGGVDYGIAPGG